MKRRQTSRRTELMIWGVSGLLVLVLPIGAVMLEGKTKSTTKSTSARKSDKKPEAKAVARSEPTSRNSAVSGRPFVETEPAPTRSDWYSGVRPVTETAAATAVAAAAVEQSPADAPNPVGSPAITSGATQTEFSVATSVPPSAGSMNAVESALATGAISIGDQFLDKAASSTNPSAAGSSPAGTASPAAVTVDVTAPVQAAASIPKTSAVAQSPEPNTPMTAPGDSDGVAMPNPEEPAERQRVEITLIRPNPKSMTSPQDEQVIFRTDLKGYSHAVVLVRSRHKGELWWAQGVTVRQGPFFRARARFGNAASVDGSLYKMTLAFVRSIEELPEDGSVFKEIPEHFLLSQEFDITLKK